MMQRGLFALSPTPSESLNLSLPAARSPFSSIPYAKVRVSLPTNPPSYSPIRQITVTGSAAPNCLLLASGWLVPILNS